MMFLDISHRSVMHVYKKRLIGLSYVKTNSNRRKSTKIKPRFFRVLKYTYFVLKVSRKLVTS